MHLQSVTLFPEQYPTYDLYPFSQPIFHQTKQLIFSAPVTLFVGENGAGKSTLLEAIARRCGIYIWEGIERARFTVNPYEDALYRYMTVEWVDGVAPGSFFASDLFRNFTQLVDEWAADDPGTLKYFGGHSLVTQSHGQSILAFCRARYQITGLYLLDEPETALSPKSQVQLLKLLHEMGQAGHAQFIIATHSPILMACPEAQIYSFDALPVTPIAYEATEHYRIYKEFMADYRNYLQG